MARTKISPMTELNYVAKMNFNRVEIEAWVDRRKRPDGDYDLIGMSRRTEYDATTGAVVSDKTEPTSLTGWAQQDAINPRRS